MARDYSKAKRVKRRVVRIGDHNLDIALSGLLNMYCADVTEAVDAAGKEMIEELVELTAIDAPRDSGDFRRAITSKTVKRPTGNLYIWGVEAPLHRITHLLVHGHATVNGGRVPGNSFLSDALAEVLPEYERKVAEAITNAGK